MAFDNKIPHTTLINKEYRPDIDGLRAFAILAVIVFHAFPNKLKGGFVGVDIFFVISGFLISRIIFQAHAGNHFSFRDFYARRINRIFPALIVVLFACFGFGWFVLLPDEFSLLTKHIASGAGFVQNIVLMREVGYFDTLSDLKPLLHLWSLAIEEQYYFFYPLIIWAAWKWHFNILRIIASLAIMSFALNLAFVGNDPTGTFFLPHTRVWELLAGGVLAYLQFSNKSKLSNLVIRITSHPSASIHKWPHERRSIFIKNTIATFGLLLLLASIFGLNKNKVFPGWWALVPVFGAVCVIMAGQHAWINRTVLSSRLMVWIGLISYPLYLWHWPLMSFARIIEDGEPTTDIQLGVIGLSFVLAWLTYQLVERPMRGWQFSGIKPLVLCGALFVVGVLGYATFMKNGQAFMNGIQYVNRFDIPYKQSCSSLTGQKYRDDWCNKGNVSTAPNFVVLGDSFSNAYSPMFSRVLIKTGSSQEFVQFARGECPSLLNYGPAFCREITLKQIEYVKANPSIKTIVLASNWPAYFDGRDYVGIKHHESADAFKKSFEETIRFYQGLGKRVVILLAPPVGANPKSCVERSVRLGKQNGCDLSLEVALKNDGYYRQWMMPILQRLSIDTFDPFNYFCDGKYCRTTDGKRIFYADISHLSVYGGEYLVETGQDELLRLIQISTSGSI